MCVMLYAPIEVYLYVKLLCYNNSTSHMRWKLNRRRRKKWRKEFFKQQNKKLKYEKVTILNAIFFCCLERK